MSSSLVYRDDQHNPKELLRPLLDDIVLYLNSEGKICYGLVTAILTKNRVTVKTNLYGKPTFLPMHSRLLNLLFRHSEWDQDVPSSCFSQPNPVNEKLKEAENLTIWKCDHLITWNCACFNTRSVTSDPNLFLSRYVADGVTPAQFLLKI